MEEFQSGLKINFRVEVMWYVLYTKPKAEKKVAGSLENLDVQVYCPLISVVRQWSDRKKKVKIPLFTSYVFVNLKERERHKVFEVPGVVKYLYWLGRPAVVRDMEIEVIKSWLNGDEVEQIAVEHLSPGDRIRIESGSFKDQDAVIKEIGAKKSKLILTELGCTITISTRNIMQGSTLVKEQA